MTGFHRDDRVRITWPGTDLHGRTATIRQQATIVTYLRRGTPDRTTGPGYSILLDQPAANGSRVLIVAASRLTPEGGEQR